MIEKLKQVRDRGVEWLQEQRTQEYGWPSGDTARIVIALASAIEDWPAKNDLVARLIVKQLEIELLEKLLRLVLDYFYSFPTLLELRSVLMYFLERSFLPCMI